MSHRRDQYDLYLKSDHWIAFRKMKAEYTPKRCAACGCGGHVDLHHMIYRNPLELVQLNDTCWLCRDCHETFHDLAGVQIKVPYEHLLAATIQIITKTSCYGTAEKIARKTEPPRVRQDSTRNWKKISIKDQKKRMTRKGGYTRQTLEFWGIVWPPKKGWQQKLSNGEDPNK